MQTYIAYVTDVTALQYQLGRYSNEDFVLQTVVNGVPGASEEDCLDLLQEYQIRRQLVLGTLLMFEDDHPEYEGVPLPESHHPYNGQLIYRAWRRAPGDLEKYDILLEHVARDMDITVKEKEPGVLEMILVSARVYTETLDRMTREYLAE